MQSINKLRVKILFFTLITTFLVIRLILYISPNADFNIAGYNIHHLYTGILLVLFAGIPLIIFSHSSRVLDFATAVFGVGLSLILDEWLYLIATDGSNSAYFLPVSIWGGLIFIGITCFYIGILYFTHYNSDNNKK